MMTRELAGRDDVLISGLSTKQAEMPLTKLGNMGEGAGIKVMEMN